MRPFLSCFILLSCIFFMPPVAHSETITFDDIQLKINANVYHLEYADTFERRARGLMHRASLCKDCGMLFKFSQPRMAGFWMKNTLIPLDIAFVRADGTITDIKAMQPHDLTTTNSSQSVLYAWEMNQGWFAKNAIKVGDTVVIPVIKRP